MHMAASLQMSQVHRCLHCQHMLRYHQWREWTRSFTSSHVECEPALDHGCDATSTCIGV